MIDELKWELYGNTVDVPIGRNVHAEHCVGDETVKCSWKLINYSIINWNQICSQWIKIYYVSRKSVINNLLLHWHNGRYNS